MVFDLAYGRCVLGLTELMAGALLEAGGAVLGSDRAYDWCLVDGELLDQAGGAVLGSDRELMTGVVLSLTENLWLMRL